MKKGWKKNQVIITALALMIAVAGYVSYTRSNIDGTAVDTAMDLSEDNFEISDDPILEGDIFTDTGDGLETAQSTETGNDVALGENLEGTVENAAAGEAVDAGADAQAAGEENPGEAVLTSSTISNVDFAAEMKLNREQVRAKNKETLLGIVNSANLTDEQKQSAVDQMITLTDIAEREAAAEMLLEAKGFTDVVVSITDNAVDVVLNMGDVTDAKRAQIEDIVKRKTNISGENIIITPIETTASNTGESKEPAGEGTEGTETEVLK
ncbi:MAG: SpoIIIAH-like family protein [Lachnospiraceae bacterium]|nr:SpoIIIAH-like family protein [Lachnospiraceae bacterium]